MNRKLIISLEDIKLYYPLSQDIPLTRVMPHISTAQQLDLRPLMNDALYTEFMTNFDDAGTSPAKYAIYQRMLAGENYVYAGQTIEYPGLIPIVVYYSLARYIEAAPINLTKFGVTVKDSDHGTSLDNKQINQQVLAFRSQAIAYGEHFKRYAAANIVTFPLYGFRYGSQSKRTGLPFY